MASPNNIKAVKVNNLRLTVKNLLKFLKYYWVSIIFGLICAGIGTVLSIIGPNQISKISTLLFNAPVEMSAIGKIAIGLIIIYLCSFLFSFLQSFLMSGVTSKISKDFRNRISKKINRLPLSYLDKTPTGDVLSRVTNDVDTVSQTLNQSLSNIITSITTLIGVLIMMISISGTMTLASLLILPISMGLMIGVVKKSQKYFNHSQWEWGFSL